jgi:Mce-associated membrane protein
MSSTASTRATAADRAAVAPADRLPWVVAAVLAVIAVALGAVILFVIHPDKQDKQKLAAATGLTALQQQAIDAASKQAVNLTTYSRATFDADYARTVAGSTGALKADLSDSTRKSTLLKQMQSGKFDLQGSVSSAAFEAESGGKYSVLVLTQSYQVLSNGQKTAATPNRFQLTMLRIDGKWLASDLLSVGLI